MPEKILPEHVLVNRKYWDDMADEWVGAGEKAWRSDDPRWGCWQIPEVEVGMLPGDMGGMKAIELGCGTAYVSAWMARRGAEVVGIDNSERQLATARRLAEEHGVEMIFHHGNAEQVPYPDRHFDFAISEYGAAIWCDPKVWIPEAHRVLKAGAHLVFLGNAPLAMVCTPGDGGPCERSLHRSYFDLDRLDWSDVENDPGGMEFNMPISSWLRLIRDSGFELVDYIELRPPKDAPSRFESAEWAHSWPAEHVFKLRRME